jgi:superfamily II DNA or RNA helicase
MTPSITIETQHDGIAGLLSSLSVDSARRGREFEELCRWYLLNDPVYRAQLSRVWRWKEWPGRWGNDEAGIDLVAEARDGKLWAIQAKAYDPDYSIKKADVDTFLSESARSEFSYRLLIASTNRLARRAERAMRAQEKPVGQVLLHHLERAEVAWPASISDLRPALFKPKDPRPHQQAAIDAVVAGCAHADRGQVIMACGTGKTLVALRSAEALGAERTLVLVPSLSLLRQTIQEWTLNSSREFNFLPVCSDDTVRNHDQIVASVAELGFPATGNPQTIREFLARSGPRVVFSTYQSSPAVAFALKLGDFDFDLAIADEAHRCAGAAASDFATILDDDKIPVKKRIFMTATPRYFSGKLRGVGTESEFEIVSMDDDARFGSVFHRLSFGDAIKRDLLSDYRVLVIGVDDVTYLEYARKGLFVTRDGREVTDARSIAAQIGIAKAIRKYDLRRVITFHSRVKGAEKFSTSLPDVVEWLPCEDRPSGQIWSEYVSGEMNAGMREARLQRLREVDANSRGILSNARCLSEGVDVPALDGVAFVDPKRSAIDIAQAVGRAIRKSGEKELGTIIIPVFIGRDDDAEVALDGSAFKPVWDVARALREHDSELAEALDELRRGLGGRSATPLRLPSKLVVDLPRSIGAEFSRAFDVHLVESCTANFEQWFGLLLRYIEREGNARVSQSHREGALNLGSWAHNQRMFYKRGQLAADRSARLESLPGWSWDLRGANWEDGFVALTAYIEREGNARVPRDYVEGEVNLGVWVGTQRGFYKSGKLEKDRVARLSALPGWSWDTLQDSWDDAFDALTAYIEREGHARIPRTHVEVEIALGNWVLVQRQTYKAGKLAAERIAKLNALPDWSWDPKHAAWECGFAELSAFAEREGHTDVARHHVQGKYLLGSWVHNQRNFYRRRKIAAERVKRLEALPGWSWGPKEDAWEKGFAALTSYLTRTGHTRVAQGHIECGVDLRIWIQMQRQYRRKNKLSADRISRLGALTGWSWEPQQAAWEKGFAALIAFVGRKGNARVPRDHVESGIKLGSWVATQRRFYIEKRMMLERTSRLEAIPGWVWDAS